MKPILTAIIILLLLSVYWCSDRPTIQRPEWLPGEKEYITQRLKHHGINGCICEGNRCYFYREGRKCWL